MSHMLMLADWEVNFQHHKDSSGQVTKNQCTDRQESACQYRKVEKCDKRAKFRAPDIFHQPSGVMSGVVEDCAQVSSEEEFSHMLDGWTRRS